MFTSFDYSVEKVRREEVRREVATNRLVGSLRSDRMGRKGIFRFVRGLRAEKAGPEGARA